MDRSGWNRAVLIKPYTAWINPTIAAGTHFVPVRALFRRLIREGVCSRVTCGWCLSDRRRSSRLATDGPRLPGPLVAARVPTDDPPPPRDPGLQARHRELMDELHERYGSDPPSQLITIINRLLAGRDNATGAHG